MDVPDRRPARRGRRLTDYSHRKNLAASTGLTTAHTASTTHARVHPEAAPSRSLAGHIGQNPARVAACRACRRTDQSICDSARSPSTPPFDRPSALSAAYCERDGSTDPLAPSAEVAHGATTSEVGGRGESPLEPNWSSRREQSPSRGRRSWRQGPPRRPHRTERSASHKRQAPDRPRSPNRGVEPHSRRLAALVDDKVADERQVFDDVRVAVDGRVIETLADSCVTLHRRR